MSDPKVCIKYIRYNLENAETMVNKNLYAKIFHVDQTKIPSHAYSSIQLLYRHLLRVGTVKQKFVTPLAKADDVVEWDSLHFCLRNIDTNSGLIVFILEKNTVYRFVNANDKLLDYYLIPQSSLLTNPQLVYNTDNFYLLEQTRSIAFLESLPTAENEIDLIEDPDVRRMYREQYTTMFNILLDEEVSKVMVRLGHKLNPVQINLKRKLTRESLLKNDAVRTAIEQKAIATVNGLIKSKYCAKYLGNFSAEIASDLNMLIDAIQRSSYTTRCLLPTGLTRDPSEINLSLHYQFI